MANAIRTYFGDGSEFGVRMVYATEDTPLGTAGSVRNAMDELDERFLVISGDVLTDIDLTPGRRLPRPAGGAGHDRPQGGREPARVRHRDHPTRTGRSSGSSRSRPGARSSATPSTPASSCSSPRSSTTSPRAEPVDFSERGRSPTLLAAGKAAVRRRRRGLLGGRRHARGLRPGPQGHPRPARCRSTSRASSSARRRVAGRGGRDRPRARSIDGPAVIGDNCRIEAGRPPRRVLHVLGANVRVRRRRRPRAVGGPRQRLPRLRRAPRGSVVGRGVRPAPGRPVRGGRGARRRVLRRRERRASRPGSRCTRSRRSRPAPSSTPRSCGSRGAPGRCSAATACPGLANVDITPELAVRAGHGLRHRPSRRAPRSSRRGTPAGRPGCSSGR